MARCLDGRHCRDRPGHPGAAITAWSVFGAYDWSSVLRDPSGRYEGGAFDVSLPGAPRRTALADAVAVTAAAAVGDTRPTPSMTHAGPADQGWWQRADRILYRPDQRPGDQAAGLERRVA